MAKLALVSPFQATKKKMHHSLPRIQFCTKTRSNSTHELSHFQQRRGARPLTNTHWDLTSEETLHGFAVGHLQEAAARVRGQGGVGAVRQQDANHVQVVVLHGVVDRPGHKGFIWSERIGNKIARYYVF